MYELKSWKYEFDVNSGSCKTVATREKFLIDTLIVDVDLRRLGETLVLLCFDETRMLPQPVAAYESQDGPTRCAYVSRTAIIRLRVSPS